MQLLQESPVKVLLRKGLIHESQASLSEEQIRDYVPPEEYAKALAEATGLEYIDPRTDPPDPDLVRRVPTVFLGRHNSLPWRKVGAEVVVLVADPRDPTLHNSLRSILKVGVRLAVAPAPAIRSIIGRLLEGQGEEIRTTVAATRVTTLSYPSVEDLQGNSAKLSRLISEAITARATDIHIEIVDTHARVRFRVDGILFEHEKLTLLEAEGLISVIKNQASLDTAERRIPQDGRLAFRSTDGELTANLRVSTIKTIRGEEAVLRILPREDSAPSLDELGFNADILKRLQQVVRYPNGMFLVTGPTGSGKTTTLFALLREALEQKNPKILSVEDPVEYKLPGISQVQVNEDIKLTFARVLKAFLRQDPDVILVGEIRDEETAVIAAKAAMTGHLVFGTLHTNDAPSAIGRLVEMGVEPFRLVESIRGVLAQRLVPKLCPHCSIPDPNAERYLIEKVKLDPQQVKPKRKGSGCNFCKNIGFYGRVAIHELFWITKGVREAIAQGKSTRELAQIAAKEARYQPLLHDGFNKVADGIADIRWVYEAARTE